MNWRDRIHIGTSGWHYADWKGPFYPEQLADGEMLEYYSGRFQTVEINNSFYNLPSRETLEAWFATTPEQFLFSAKASRYLTHMKKLKDPEEPLQRFLDGISVLEGKLGPILFQLPPHWNSNPDRLESFLDILPEGDWAFEFRDQSWHSRQVYDLLKERNAAFCVFDLDGTLSPTETTSRLVYVRLHGPGPPYKGCYTKGALSGWAGRLSAWARRGKSVYLYFDNDEQGYAAQNAADLQQMLSEESSDGS